MALADNTTRTVYYAIVRLSSMGDILHTSPILKILKDYHQAHNEYAHITWVVEPKFYDVVKHFSDVDRLLSVPLPSKLTPVQVIHFIKAFLKQKIFKKLRSTSYDVILDPQGLLKSALTARLMKSSRRIGFGGRESREFSACFYHERVYTHELNIVDKNRELLNPLKLSESHKKNDTSSIKNKNTPRLTRITLQPKATARIKDFLKTKKLQKTILIAPWSTFYTRDLGPDLLNSVIKTLTEYFNTPLILLSDPTKRSKAEKIKHQHSDKIVMPPPLDLSELFSLIAKSHLLVGVDSGPAYIAEILEKKVIICFGPTNRYRQSPSYSKYLSSTLKSEGTKYEKTYAQSSSHLQNKHSFHHPSTAAIVSNYQCPIIKPEPIHTSYKCIHKNCTNQIRCMTHYQQQDILTALKHLNL